MNRTMTALFLLMIGTGMSVVWDAFFRIKFLSTKVCSNKTKLNFGLLILEILSLIKTTLGWSSYF